jgi:hypothetical protein
MGTHPNVILMAVLTPHGLSRKTMRDIVGDSDTRDSDNSSDVKIGGEWYHSIVMEGDYYEPTQIAAKEGDLVFYELVTYGYGEVITWAALEHRKLILEEWAKSMSEKHHCDYRIDVSANYW